jgi:iron complex outermembrane receptor protein
MHKKNIKPLFQIIILAFSACLPVYANDDNKKGPPNEPPTPLEKVIVIGKKPRLGIAVKDEITEDDIAAKQAQVSDTAKLLEDTAGVSLQAGGGVSSLPIIHGLNDNRIKIDVNGVTVNSSCPNHMNPPLSYIDRANIGNIIILKGVTPVSMGGDSIGGTISVQSAEPVFAEDSKQLLLNAKASSFYRSNGNAFGSSISAGMANEYARLDYSGSYAQSGNYKDGNGKTIKSSSYKSQNHAAALSFRLDNHLLEIRGGLQNIPFQGFPTARMDLTSNDSVFGNLHYKGTFDWGGFDAKLYLENTSHTMDFGSDRHAVEPMPMKTHSRNLGYKLQAEIPFGKLDTFRFGNEFTSSLINDFWPPTSSMPSMMGPNTFLNINNATRDRVGTFAEWERTWSEEWKSMLGFRYDRTMTDAGSVQGYNNIVPNRFTQIPDYYQAQAFNNLDHQRNFDMFDVAALMRFTPNLWSQYDLGYARKNRAPSLHELYVWSTSPMPMTMNGWFGDGNGYFGNMNLKQEAAHNITITANYYDPRNDSWSIKVEPFFSYVENFIDVDRCGSCMQPGNGFYYLRFSNHDARLWGVDVTGRVDLIKDKQYGKFSTHSIMSYVRGERMDSGNLYHMMPFNIKLSLNHELGGWKSAFEMQFVDVKDDIQTIRNELKTSSYVLLNTKVGYQWRNISLDVGMDNILNKQYYYPLSGVYIGDQSAMTLSSSRPNTQNLPGFGRSVYIGLTFSY